MAESSRDTRPSDEARAKRLYEAWLAAAAPAASHPWEGLSDDDKAVWQKVVEAIRS